MKHNVSFVANSETARTNIDAAQQRAENLAILGASNVLELCVGPSLETFERAYSRFGIRVTGNDIERRWQQYYPQGKWIIGDALDVDYCPFDAVVFAPPLSKGCTGRREDSLSINDVTPGYYRFLARLLQQNYRGVPVLVLPARCLATHKDRKELYKLLTLTAKNHFEVDLVALECGRRKIRKYVDLYLQRDYTTS